MYIVDWFHHSIVDSASVSSSASATDAENIWYYIQHDSGLVLDVRNSVKVIGSPLSLQPKSGHDKQKWKLLPDGHLQNALGYYLEVFSGRSNPETPLWAKDREESTAQLWMYDASERSLTPQINPKLAVDVLEEASQGALPCTYTKNNTSSQRWSFVPV